MISLLLALAVAATDPEPPMPTGREFVRLVDQQLKARTAIDEDRAALDRYNSRKHYCEVFADVEAAANEVRNLIFDGSVTFTKNVPQPFVHTLSDAEKHDLEGLARKYDTDIIYWRHQCND